MGRIRTAKSVTNVITNGIVEGRLRFTFSIRCCAFMVFFSFLFIIRATVLSLETVMSQINIFESVPPHQGITGINQTRPDFLS